MTVVGCESCGVTMDDCDSSGLWMGVTMVECDSGCV